MTIRKLIIVFVLLIKKIGDICKSSSEYTHLKIINPNDYLHPSHYTNHGLHLNYSGKKILSNLLFNTLEGNPLTISHTNPQQKMARQTHSPRQSQSKPNFLSVSFKRHPTPPWTPLHRSYLPSRFPLPMSLLRSLSSKTHKTQNPLDFIYFWVCFGPNPRPYWSVGGWNVKY